MHPVFTTPRVLFSIIGLWIALATLLTFAISRQLGLGFLPAAALFFPMMFFLFFFSISNFHISAHFGLENTRFYKLIAVQIIALILTIAIWLSCGAAYVQLLHRINELPWSQIYQDSLLTLALHGSMVYGFWILVHYLYFIAQKHDALKRAALENKLLISQTELQAVKAAVHPHFLFNSLNTIANIALTDSNKVHSLCLQISQFLRYSVAYSQHELVTVADELEHIQNYLGIERERFGERLSTEFNINEDSRQIKMLPLLLFPLIENCINHGINSLIEGGTISLTIEYDDRYLIITIANRFDPLGCKKARSGLGLDSIRKRIQAYYGSSANLSCAPSNDHFQATLQLPVLP
jgi:sensor histidine kinase YesM